MEATLDRKAALEAADYVVSSFQIGGLDATKLDFEVPKRFGLRQTIADTLGVGGIMRALRTIPVLLDVCADMEEVRGCAAAAVRQPDVHALLGSRGGELGARGWPLPLGPGNGARPRA